MGGGKKKGFPTLCNKFLVTCSRIIIVKRSKIPLNIDNAAGIFK
jgi:hypothetical protein